jgi:GT2 family glycosyltransferase
MTSGEAGVPTASVIVLNFNGEKDLPDCLGSLQQQTLENVELIVADNGSSDSSEAVVKGYQGVRWLSLGENHGFARGNDLAAKYATAEILVFVNNDMRFAPDFVEQLVTPLRSNPDLFATDARQRDWNDERDLHLRTVVHRVSLIRSFGSHRPSLPGLFVEQQQAHEATACFQPCAGNMAVRRWMFEALAGLDPRMKAGWEDTDLALKAWLRGWPTVFVPKAVCWHRVGVASSSSPEGRSMRRQGEMEGRLVLAARHLPFDAAFLVFASTFVAMWRDVFRRSADASFRRNALVSSAGWLPAVLSERRRIYAAARTTPRAHIFRLERILSDRLSPSALDESEHGVP